MDSIEPETTSPETHRETEQEIPRSTKIQEYVVIACVCMIRFGDAVEVYLPGVITQQVACDMHRGLVEEGVLGVAIFFAKPLTILIVGPISEKLGRRTVILASLYACVLATVFCAIVPNYWTLVLSRLLIGMSIGMNTSTVGVYLGEMVKSEKLYKVGTFLSLLCFASGGGWIGLLGYGLLETLGWRMFVLCTSIPIFVLPILLFHVYLPETPAFEEQTNKPSLTTAIKGIKLIALKLTVLAFITCFDGHGSILRLPSFIKHDNEQRGLSGTPNCSAVFGNQFLVLALVGGGCNILGRTLGYMLHGNLSFRKYMLCMAVVSTVCYGGMFFTSNILYLEILIGFVKLQFAATLCELCIQSFNPRVLGDQSFAASCALIWGVGHSGGIFGNTLAVLTPVIVNITCCFVLSLVNIVMVCTVSEI